MVNPYEKYLKMIHDLDFEIGIKIHYVFILYCKIWNTWGTVLISLVNLKDKCLTLELMREIQICKKVISNQNKLKETLLSGFSKVKRKFKTFVEATYQISCEGSTNIEISLYSHCNHTVNTS